MMAPMVAVPLAILVALVSSPLVAEAQPTAKVYRVGVLSNALDTADGPSFRAFLDGLHGLGYVEHKNVDIEWRSSEGDNDQLPDLAASLVRAKVDVILAMALQPARAASEATRTTPIVFVVAADPVAQRLVTSSGGPTGNVTGVSAYDARESSEKVVELLKAATPKLSRLGVMLVPGNPVHQELMAQPLPSAAQRAGAALVPLRVETITDVQPALERAGETADHASPPMADRRHERDGKHGRQDELEDVDPPARDARDHAQQHQRQDDLDQAAHPAATTFCHGASSPDVDLIDLRHASSSRARCGRQGRSLAERPGGQPARSSRHPRRCGGTGRGAGRGARKRARARWSGGLEL